MVIDLSDVDLGEAGAIATAINAELGGTNLSVAITTSGTNTVFTITDALGRDFDAASFIDAGEEAEDSVTTVGPLTDAVVLNEVGQFSVTIGKDTDNPIVLELFDVSDLANIGALATAIETQLQLMDGDAAHITVAPGAGDDAGRLVITDTLGRGISDVYIGAPIEEDDASVATISGLTDLLAGLADGFTIKVGSLTYTLDGDTEVDDGEEGQDKFEDIDSIEDLAVFIQAALQAADAGREDITVAVGEDGQSLVITDAAGRALSEAALTVAKADIPSIATVAGMTDDAVNLDLGYIKVVYEDEGGDEQEFVVAGLAEEDLAALVAALNAGGPPDGMTFEGINNKLIIHFDGKIVSVSTLTGEDGLQVGEVAVIVDGVEEAEDFVLGDVSYANSATGGQQALFGVEATLVEAGNVEGIDAMPVGGAGVPTAAVETMVGAAPVYEDGVAEGSDADPVGTLVQTVVGAEAVEAAAWTATFDVSFTGELAKAYTFTLTLTEVLGEDAEEGAEAAVTTFTLEAAAGDTAADVLAAMVAAIDDSAAFSAALNDDGALVVTAEALTTNYDVETTLVLVGVVEDNGM